MAVIYENCCCKKSYILLVTFGDSYTSVSLILHRRVVNILVTLLGGAVAPTAPWMLHYIESLSEMRGEIMSPVSLNRHEIAALAGCTSSDEAIISVRSDRLGWAGLDCWYYVERVIDARECPTSPQWRG